MLKAIEGASVKLASVNPLSVMLDLRPSSPTLPCRCLFLEHLKRCWYRCFKRVVIILHVPWDSMCMQEGKTTLSRAAHPSKSCMPGIKTPPANPFLNGHVSCLICICQQDHARASKGPFHCSVEFWVCFFFHFSHIPSSKIRYMCFLAKVSVWWTIYSWISTWRNGILLSLWLCWTLILLHFMSFMLKWD